jgi:hypothetical protein
MQRNTPINDTLSNQLDRLAGEQAMLKQELKEGAIRNAARDLQMAEEWFPLEEEAWQKHQEGKDHAK